MAPFINSGVLTANYGFGKFITFQGGGITFGEQVKI